MKRRLLAGCAGVLLAPILVLAWLAYLATARVEGETFDSNGVAIHYTVEGEGPPLILIHGFAAHADINWRRPGILGRLKRDFRVISFDCRGHGLSGQPTQPEAYGMEMLHDVTRLMDHLGIARAHLCGYSMGGFLAVALAAHEPERVLSVAACAAGWIPPGEEDFRSPYRPPPEGYRSPYLETHLVRAGHAPREAALLPVPALAAWLDPIRDFVGDRMIKNKDALRACKKSLRTLSVPEEKVAAIDVPLICFMGSKDGLLPYADALKTVRPETEYVILEGANHITIALRGEFKRRLRAFFLAHRGEGAEP